MAEIEAEAAFAVANATVTYFTADRQDSFLMTSLLTLILGGCVTFVSLLFFGFAVHKGWGDDLTPRISNRPKMVLKNAMLYHLPYWMKKSSLWYPIAWIGWAYHLTYKECLKGIPGTGTRNDGLEGPLLKTNLDAVIMMRFHTLLFKVSVLVALLCTCVILPVNLTAGCDVEKFGNGTCAQREINNTLFRRTTIANIPDKIYNNDVNTIVNVTFETGDFLFFVPNDDDNSTEIDVASLLDEGDYQLLSNMPWIADQTIRVLATVISCVIIYIYTFYLLAWEWCENIAMRRKYFLEATHYSQRMAELNKMAVESQRVKKESLRALNNVNCLESNAVIVSRLRQQDETNANRPEYLTHPEIRETPPSIGIYSVLYQLPRSMVTYDTYGATTLERQLVATTNFFDEIIPPQAGFSSSVAAVTVLPNATLLAKANSKWEICEKKVQRLRVIRRQIRTAKKKQEDYELKRQKKLLQEREELVPANAINNEADAANRNTTYGSKSRIVGSRIGPDGSIASISSSDNLSIGGEKPQQQQQRDIETPEVIDIISEETPPSPLRASATAQERSLLPVETTTAPIAFRYEVFDVSEYASSIGFHEEVHDTFDFVKGMDIEEFNVFASKCAALAGRDTQFKRPRSLHGIEILKEEEIDLVEELRVANKELLQARENVAMLATDEELEESKRPMQPSIHNEDSDDDTSEVFGNYESSGLRRRKNIPKESGSVAKALPGNLETKYDTIAREHSSPKPSILQKMLGFFGYFFRFLRRIYRGMEGDSNNGKESLKYYGTTTTVSDGEAGRAKAFVTNLNYPAYAVVTFTTRKSAVIARQCLSDGAARNHWKQADDIPIYPLADAPPYALSLRPVTPMISYASNKIRFWIIYIVLMVFTVTNVYIVQRINSLILNPDLFGDRFVSLLSPVTALTQSLLFSICPVIFKVLANIEGSATSMDKAEQKAIIYFWYFFIIARFMGQIIWNITLRFFFDGSTAEDAINEGLSELAQTVPTTLGPSALSYILFSSTITWPALYFMPSLNFSTRFLRLNYLNRVLKKGGLGNEVPYRIYVDSGYTFACMTALAPLCPLLGPICLLYMIIVVPMLRWLLVFGYRPAFDGGGDKWPKLHHMIVTSLLLGQVITAITLVLKQNVWEGFFIALFIIPTVLYNSIILEKYLRPYQDAALLQTSRMYYQYGRDSNPSINTSSWLEQEEYRRWLVDCHKASYLPTCLSGGETNILTTEPAVVIAEGKESAINIMDPRGDSEIRNRNDAKEDLRLRMKLMKRQKAQKGGILRRQRFNI